MRIITTILIVITLMIPALAGAQVPRMINYQGVLTDGGGTAITGDHALTFTIYNDSAVAATILWTETHPVVTVTDGLFHVILGSVAALPDSAMISPELWLGTTVDADPEIAPRSMITSVPWSIRAAFSDSAATTADHVHDDLYYTEIELSAPGVLNDLGNPVDWTKLKSVPGDFADGVDDVGGPDADWIISGSDMYSAVIGSVGIGTPTPEEKLDVDGTVKASGLTMTTGAVAGYLLTTDATGSASWQPAPGTGDITGVTAGTGLTGGGLSGDVTLDADFSGSGVATTISRSDHEHDAAYVNEAQASSVTSDMITDGEIVDADVSAGAAIDPAKISGTAWTSANDGATSGLDADLLDGLESAAFSDTAHLHDDRYYTETELSSAGTLNDGGNPVDWTKLKSVPGDFADGVDDIGGPDADWIISGSDMYSAVIGSVGIGTPTPEEKLDVDGTVKASGLTMTTGAVAGYLLTTDATGSASWQPAPGTGDITGVTAGTGLTGGGLSGDVTLDADFSGSGVATTISRSDHEHDAAYVNEAQASSVTSDMITDGEIVDADVSAGAAIDPAKISGTAWTSANDGATSGLDADLLDGLESAAFSDTAHLHDDRYYTETELSSAGTLNDGGNPVDWTKLKSVPGDFADGIDNVGTDADWTISGTDLISGTTGNVGIGEPAPTAKLHVKGSSGNYALIGHSTYGLYGYHQTASNYGFLGSSTYGAYGKDSNTGSYGFLGSGLTGVGGHSTTAAGVSGTSTSGYGVYGFSDFSWAGYFQGDIRVVGTVTEGAVATLIDHPLDPENKLLRNSAVESPENLLIYRGKIDLDSNGEAIVTMPDYFVALVNEDDATVSLTPVGRPFLTGYEWRTDKASFVVYGEANRAVSWMAMADRDDPVSRQLAAPVVEEKGGENGICDRGELLYPTAYGYPESKGVDFNRLEELKAER